MTLKRSSENVGWRMGKFHVENGKNPIGETFLWGNCSKKVIRILSHREMLFYKKALLQVIDIYKFPVQ